ncbi:MAG: preprotein translocase subunit SecY [Desulfurococcales archaeon]|nr:preprotein translocase subunit SecY [Desulfurococcales archaeon]MCE4626548.1 preprotein translocase subunit SecY [Desulfurococcales archaeon]MCE4629491.1 preprotein translocase subunit SecY [Desulfurococcales archaeon]
MGVLDILAAVADRFPTVEKPVPRPSLYRRLAWTGIILVLYLVMANIPLYGIPAQATETTVSLQRIIFASSAGSLMELGIGPIVTAGLILQVLVGAKLIDIDLNDPEARKKFTAAQKSLAIFFAVFEATMYVIGNKYWQGTGITPSWSIKILVIAQLAFAAFLVQLFDEMLQKGWGLGSAISLFILAGVAYQVFWSLLGYVPRIAETYGFIPALFNERSLLLIARPNGYPDLTGLFATIAIILFLVYVQAMRVEIPVTSARLRGIRTRVPLQFMYVTNIPILLVGILVADLQLFNGIIQNIAGPESTIAHYYQQLVYYVTPPRGIIPALSDPLRTVAFTISWTIMAVGFGYMWVELSGLNPSDQAEKLVKSGMEVPGMRRNPRILEGILAKYIYPLTLLSSLIVAAIAIIADIFGAYGTGTGILLAVGIINQYYMMISYERALETYPLLRKILGEG